MANKFDKNSQQHPGRYIGVLKEETVTNTAGDGLDITQGGEFSLDLKSNGGLVIESTELAVDLGASSITGLLNVGDGGTGASSLTNNSILTGTGTSPITAESSLTYVNSGNTSTLTIGEDTQGSRVIKTLAKGVGQNGDAFALVNGDCGAGTNIRGGVMEFYSGGATGSRTAGHYMFLGGPMRNPSGGSQASAKVEQMFLFRDVALGNIDITNLRLMAPTDARNYFNIGIQDPGITTISTVDVTGGTGFGADLQILADGALVLQSTDASNDIKLESAGEIKLNADGGNIDFVNNTAHFAKLTNLLNGRGQLALYGGSCGNQSCGAQIDFYEDTGAGSNYITLKGLAVGGGIGSNKTINLPNASGTVALMSDIPGDIVNTKQIILSRDGYGSIFALFYGSKWYNASGGTYSWGSGSTPNLDTYNAQQKGMVYTKGPLVTAVSNMKIYKVYMNFFWYSKQAGVCNSARDMEFSFHSATHANNSQAEHTLSSAIVATNLNAAYSCDTQYNLVFELAGGSGYTLNAGDSLHMFMRCTSYNASSIIFGQVIGQIYVEYKYV